jgi:hypothetical protein
LAVSFPAPPSSFELENLPPVRMRANCLCYMFDNVLVYRASH